MARCCVLPTILHPRAIQNIIAMVALLLAKRKWHTGSYGGEYSVRKTVCRCASHGHSVRTKWLRWRRLIPCCLCRRRLCSYRHRLLLALGHQLLRLVWRGVTQHHKPSRHVLQRHVSVPQCNVMHASRLCITTSSAPAGCDAVHIALLWGHHSAGVFQCVAGRLRCCRCYRCCLLATPCCCVARVHCLGLALSASLGCLDGILLSSLHQTDT